MSYAPDPMRLDFESLVLSPLSALYWLGWRGYEAVYRLRLKKPYRARVPVVCVGNLLVGGSGKSPTTIMVARRLLAGGTPVVLSLSGYGAPRAQAASVAPSGPLDAREWGDEPAMVRWLEPHLPIIVGRRRVLAAQLAEGQFPGHVLLLDDGFQHLPLYKDRVLLLDPMHVKNPLVLPAGPYRQPRSDRVRADLIVPDHVELRADVHLMTAEGQPIDPPKGTKVHLMCAIARPYRLQATVEGLGLGVIGGRFLPDHDRMQAGTLMDGIDPAFPVVVTAKDWMKLRERKDLDAFTIWITYYDVHPSDASRLDEFLDGITTHKGA